MFIPVLHVLLPLLHRAVHMTCLVELDFLKHRTVRVFIQQSETEVDTELNFWK